MMHAQLITLEARWSAAKLTGQFVTKLSKNIRGKPEQYPCTAT